MPNTTRTEEAPITLREGLRGVWRHARVYRNALILVTVLGVISAIANGAIPFVTGRFFDALIEVSHHQFTYVAGFPLWTVMLVLWALMQLIANNVDWITDRLTRKFALALQLDVQTNGFTHLLRLPIAYHTHAHIQGELQSLSSASWRIDSLLSTIVTTVPQFLSIGIGLALATTINLTLAGILAGGVTIYILILSRVIAPIAAADSKAHATWNTSWNDAAAAVTQTAAVKQSTAETHETEKVTKMLRGETFRLWYQLERAWNTMNFSQRVVVFLTQLAIFIVSVQYVQVGTISVGDLIALNGYALMFFGPIVALGRNWQIIQNGLTAAGQADRIFALPQEIYHPAGAQVANKRHGEVVFDDVSFRYEKAQADILSHMSFTVSPGHVVAFVGESGVGKSTAITLISGYYFPQKGSVCVDDIDTRQWDLTALRSRIAVVPQEVALFNGTIRENIRYGTFDASDAAVEAAAKEAHIHDSIMKQSNRYDTIVGERGIKLSVGQKQRVAIARAILRNPEFLILDEPTSALDSETERLLTASLERLMRGRTTFIVAHRLSTVRKADLILVVKGGTIVERGSHNELMAMESGTYRRLYEYHIGLHE
ncbi:MAG: hypothetical protein B7X04_00990 [Parcubacteria group bacterium 21-54-25]|nr:MAG: hypothetical protein B7X04_00990 [Parcubacteria group bacterium 21-54-25]HQU07806.1 ABC transporter ATP-binding protein [Candidatus Paceibacterota bacterium]